MSIITQKEKYTDNHEEYAEIGINSYTEAHAYTYSVVLF